MQILHLNIFLDFKGKTFGNLENANLAKIQYQHFRKSGSKRKGACKGQIQIRLYRGGGEADQFFWEMTLLNHSIYLREASFRTDVYMH